MIFVAFVGYFGVQLLNLVPMYLTQVRTEETRNEAYLISDMMVNDPGNPINWPSQEGNIKRIGMNDETQNLTNVVSTAKLNEFFNLCQSGYFHVLNWMGTTHEFYLVASEINATDGSVDAILTCQPPNLIFGTGTVNTTITRFAAINSTEYVQFILQVV